MRQTAKASRPISAMPPAAAPTPTPIRAGWLRPALLLAGASVWKTTAEPPEVVVVRIRLFPVADVSMQTVSLSMLQSE